MITGLDSSSQLVSFFFAKLLQKKTGLVLLNPILLTIAVLLIFLKMTHISYETYNKGPLLLLGIYFLGGMFGVKTIICTFAIPAFMRLIHYLYGYDALLEPGITDRTMLNEQLLSAIFGGIVYGIGIGMIFKARATSGGSDIISMILNKYTHISLGTLVIIVDCTITLSTVVAFGDWRLPMYSWIIVFIEGKVIDLIVEGASVHKTLMIVTKEMDTVKNIILNDINRGATILPAIGAYKGESREMIYTILTRREMMVLRHKIREIDPEAFINVIDSREILGKGFKSLDAE